MRDYILNIGLAVMVLWGLPSCVADSVEDINDDSDTALAEDLEPRSEPAGEASLGIHTPGMANMKELSGNQGVSNESVEVATTFATTPCGWGLYISYYYCNGGWCTYYTIANSHGYGVSRRVVKLNGSTGACLYIPPGACIGDHIWGRVIDMQAC